MPTLEFIVNPPPGDPSLTAANDQYVPGGGGSGSLPTSIKLVTAAPYNADPTNTNDCTAAFQSALNDLLALGGGELWIPPGRYKFTGTISTTLLKGVTIRGIGYSSEGDTGPRLSYTGTGSTPFWQLLSPQGVKITGVGFEHTSSSFTGPLLDFENQGSGDCFHCKIEGCSFAPAGAITTAIGLAVSAFLGGVIDRCDFSYFNRSIQYGYGTGGVYVNGTVMRDCSFSGGGSNPILLNSTDIEACLFENLTFEPIAGGLCGGFEGPTVTGLYNCTFINLFQAEGCNDGGSFMKQVLSRSGCTIIGGEIGAEAGHGYGGTGSIAFDLSGPWTIIAVRFNGNTLGATFGPTLAQEFNPLLLGLSLNSSPLTNHAGNWGPYSAFGCFGAGMSESRVYVPPSITTAQHVSETFAGEIVLNSTNSTFIIDSGAGAEIGCSIDLYADQASAIQVTAGAGVTLHAPPEGTFIDGHCYATITQIRANEWVLHGRLAAS